MARPLTILIASNVYPPKIIGGAEVIAHQQALALQRMGHNVVVFAGEPSDTDRYAFRADEYEGLPVYRIRLIGQDYEREYVHFQHHETERRFLEVFGTYAPDVVHMHNLSGLSAGIIRLAKNRGAKTVLTLHDFWGFCFKNTIIKSANGKATASIPEPEPVKPPLELAGICGNGDDTAFVHAAYWVLLGRGPDPAGIKHQLEALSNGVSREKLLVQIASTAEARVRAPEPAPIRAEIETCRDFTRCEECLPAIQDGAERNIPIHMRTDFLAWQFESVDRFVSPSHYLADQYLRAGFPLSKMRVVWNGVEVDRFARMDKAPGGRVRFGFLGYLGAHKGMQVLMDALPLLGRPANFDVNLVGTGEMLEPMKRRAQELGLEGHLHFWGQVPNEAIHEPFSHIDVLLLPSIWPENQPVSITEAMAARKPVIGARIGGIPELVEDGVTGLLFDPGNPSDLADKMRQFIRRPRLIEEYGRRGFERIAACTFERQSQKLDSLYREIQT